MAEAWRLNKRQKEQVDRAIYLALAELNVLEGEALMYTQEQRIELEQIREALHECEHCGEKLPFHNQQCVSRIARVIFEGGGTGEIWSGSKEQADRMRLRARGFAWDRHGANCSARKPWFCKSKRVWISGFAVYADHSDAHSMQQLGEYLNA